MSENPAEIDSTQTPEPTLDSAPTPSPSESNTIDPTPSAGADTTSAEDTAGPESAIQYTTVLI